MQYVLQAPLSIEVLLPLRAGDIVLLSGTIYTARDAAHNRIAAAVTAGEALPLDLNNAVIFYTGPCPAKPGAPIGPLSPTTSQRMYSYAELMLQQGMTAMIGKGDRTPMVSELCRRYGGVYFLGIGGAAALTASCVLSAEVIAYPDLGTEAIRKLTIAEMKLFVGIDTRGTSLMEQEIPKYRR